MKKHYTYFGFKTPNKIISKKEAYSNFIGNILAEYNLIYPEESVFFKNYLLGNMGAQAL